MTINYAKHDEEFHGVFKLVSGEEILAKAVLTTEDYGTDTKESLAFLQDPVCIQIIDKAMGENKMRDGYTILETCKKLEELGADVVGLNCFRGPATMLPYIKEIRKELKCHVAALPVPYRTTKKHPTFFNLPDNNGCNCPSPHGRTFPTALDPLQCNRYEIGNFAKEVFDLGVKYIGVCCGASPMHIREVAEAIGLRVPASRFRENMSKHFMYGSDKKIPKHMKEYGNVA